MKSVGDVAKAKRKSIHVRVTEPYRQRLVFIPKWEPCLKANLCRVFSEILSPFMSLL